MRLNRGAHGDCRNGVKGRCEPVAFAVLGKGVPVFLFNHSQGEHDGHLRCSCQLHDQGVRYIKQTTERAKGLVNAAANLDIKIKDIYWTMGAYDAVFTAEAADDETITAFAGSMGALGNIRTQTMRAFSADEMNKILAKLPIMDVTTSK